MDTEHARFNMIEQQIRPWEVLDQQVLDVISRTPREEYVPAEHRALAFSDINIPLPYYGQQMMRPNVEGRLLQSLAIRNTDNILEIGTGSGYLTACLAQLAKHVYSIDIHQAFTEQSGKILKAHNINNITLKTGDACTEAVITGKFDAIAITGGLPVVLPQLKQALSPNGRLFAVLGQPDTPIMEAQLITRINENQWSTESLFETSIPMLLNCEQPKQFVF